MFSLGIIFNGKTENQINYNRAQPIIVIFLGFSSCIWVLCFVLFLLLWMLLLIKFVTIIDDILVLFLLLSLLLLTMLLLIQDIYFFPVVLSFDRARMLLGVSGTVTAGTSPSCHKVKLHEGTILWTYPKSNIARLISIVSKPISIVVVVIVVVVKKS